MKLRQQLIPTLKLATPVVLTQMGSMLMGLVDVFMVGKLGPEAIGGVSIGNAIFTVFSVFGLGLLLGLDFLISHAYGRRDMDRCHYWLVQAVYFCFMVTLPFIAVIYFFSLHLSDLGIDSRVAIHAAPFLQAMCLNLLPFLLFMAFRQYLQAMNSVKAVTIIIIVANAVNAFFNWLLIFGNWGFPKLGVMGSGIATTMTRILCLAALVIFTLYRDSKGDWGLRRASWIVDLSGVKKLVQLGFPAGMQLLFEVAVFSVATTLAGRLGPVPLAAHTIVLNLASFTFMVPLGISAAAAVQVGQALGEKSPHQARTAGWTCLFLGATFMTFAGITMYLTDDFIIGLFIQDAHVVELAKRLLVLAALFQVADGIQAVGTGALRGLGDTVSAMYANLFGHWLIGLPVGYYLCFHGPYQVVGLWMGLTLSLVMVAAIVLGLWMKKSALLLSPK